MESATQFFPLQLVVEASFWYALSAKKIDELQLATEPLPLTASFTTGSPSPVDGRVFLSESSLTPENALRTGHTGVPGTLVLVNTRAEYKALDKKGAVAAAGAQLWENITSGAWVDNPSLLAPLLVLAYADLKKYVFRYLAAFPALKAAPAVSSSPASLGFSAPPTALAVVDATAPLFASSTGVPLVFLLKRHVATGEVAAAPVSEYPGFWEEGSGEGDVVCAFAVADPVSKPEHPGWVLRNVATAIAATFGLETFPVIAFRHSKAGADAENPLGASLELLVSVSPSVPGTLEARKDNLPVVGWEKNAKGAIGTKVVNLGETMDPLALMETSVDLNLKLMRWRLLPELRLDAVAETRALLLGAGTLGCNVARALMGWGVRNITFVDSGKVSYSNPVRQSLFTFADAEAGEYKAVAAAAALAAIFPGMNASGEVMTIPMPGHGAGDGGQEAYAKLIELYEGADVVFLLTDSRESRWLPTLLGAAMDKPVINTAMGFDSFVCMRHGATGPAAPAHGEGRLGCYFCSDIVAPTDSLTARSLDQACTVVRPGNSFLASSMAVELFVALLHHPEGNYAPAELALPLSQSTPNKLGLIPHQIRGYMTHYSNRLVVAPAYDKCTACSPPVLSALESDGWDFVAAVLSDPDVLERVTGLEEMKARMDDDVCGWDVDEEDEDGW